MVNKVEYQVYDDIKNLLDLSICNDSNIKILHAIKDNSLIDIDSISNFKNLGIDLFNLSDSFFNDICKPYSNSNNDLILKDRIKYLYQNYFLCDDGCSYNEINTESMTISCDCKVKSNITKNITSENLEKLENIKTESSFGIIKCYKLVFSFDGKLNNYGFWIFLILIFVYFPLLIYYFLKGTKMIKDYLIKEMTENGYIKENNEKKNFKKRGSKRLSRIQITNIKRRKSRIHSPPKNNKNDKEQNVKINTINKKRKSKKLSIHNIKLIDGSSLNNIQSSNKEELNAINNINSNINNSNKKIIKFRRRSTLKKRENYFI